MDRREAIATVRARLTPMPTARRFVTVNDVAEVLNVTVRQVYGLLNSGELRGIQVGGRGIWRIEEAELDRYIERQYDEADRRARESTSGSEVGSDGGDAVENDQPPTS